MSPGGGYLQSGGFAGQPGDRAENRGYKRNETVPRCETPDTACGFRPQGFVDIRQQFMDVRFGTVAFLERRGPCTYFKGQILEFPEEARTIFCLCRSQHLSKPISVGTHLPLSGSIGFLSLLQRSTPFPLPQAGSTKLLIEMVWFEKQPCKNRGFRARSKPPK